MRQAAPPSQLGEHKPNADKHVNENNSSAVLSPSEIYNLRNHSSKRVDHELPRSHSSHGSVGSNGSRGARNKLALKKTAVESWHFQTSLLNHAASTKVLPATKIDLRKNSKKIVARDRD